jgi:hypothetical protein
MKYEQIDKKIYKIFLSDVKWIEVTRGGGVFHLTNDNMTDKKGNWVVDNTNLGIIYWDEEVQSLDACSDEAQCFGMSNKVKWKEVVLEEKNGNWIFRAENIDRLCEALGHIDLGAWCPGDI